MTENPAGLREPAALGVTRRGAPMVVAHRGGAFEAPENTLAAFRHAVEVGADWSELDVALTRDSKLVVIHDETLERTTDGNGRVDAQTLAELKRLDAGRGEKLPSLEETLAVPGARLMVELKHSPRPIALADAAVDAIRTACMQQRVVIASFDAQMLQRVHERAPELPLLGLIGDEAGLEAMRHLPLNVLGVSAHIAEKALAVRGDGVAVWAWTVETPAEAQRLSALGVDAIITDAPSAIIPAVRDAAR